MRSRRHTTRVLMRHAIFCVQIEHVVIDSTGFFMLLVGDNNTKLTDFNYTTYRQRDHLQIKWMEFRNKG